MPKYTALGRTRIGTRVDGVRPAKEAHVAGAGPDDAYLGQGELDRAPLR